tara:strand:+ start:557 stop:1507 length:951 start_codon:yes stop_codon:yes gene_type:complete
VKTYKISLIIFILSSCGGGGSSGSQDINIPIETDNNNSLNETCIDTSRSGMKRCSFKHDNLDRFYYIYTPNNIDTNESIPVLFAFHGYGSSAMRHLSYTNYFPIADSENLVVIYPQGATTATLSAHWNVGGWTSKSTINDLDFVDTIIGLTKDKILIDETRIYSSGMSNGGYMGYHLACNLSSKFAAIASVTGSMTNDTYNDCNPVHPTPILQIHGLLDFVVPYDGNAGSKSISDVIDYWVNYNSCSTDQDTVIKYDDYSLIVYDTYASCLNDVNVKLILHPEMGHDWPSLQSYNIDASIEIWNFVSKFDQFGLIN